MRSRTNHFRATPLILRIDLSDFGRRKNFFQRRVGASGLRRKWRKSKHTGDHFVCAAADRDVEMKRNRKTKMRKIVSPLETGVNSHVNEKRRKYKCLRLQLKSWKAFICL